MCEAEHRSAQMAEGTGQSEQLCMLNKLLRKSQPRKTIGFGDGKVLHSMMIWKQTTISCFSFNLSTLNRSIKYAFLPRSKHHISKALLQSAFVLCINCRLWAKGSHAGNRWPPVLTLDLTPYSRARLWMELWNCKKWNVFTQKARLCWWFDCCDKIMQLFSVCGDVNGL